MSKTQPDPLEPVRNAPASQPFVVAQLGQSLDGRIATATGESRWINRNAALDHLHRIRSEVDAVVVGIGTVLADDPRLNVRRVELPSGKPQPARVVIDPSAKLPDQAKLLDDDGARTLVIRSTKSNQNAPCEVIAINETSDGLAPKAIIKALFEQGLKKLLIEGGAQTVSRFIDAGAIDRLHVLVAPMIIGSGKSGLELKAIDKLDCALRPPTQVLLLDDGDVLFDCDLKATRANL